MKKSILLAALMSISLSSFAGDEQVLNNRAPLKAVTQERAAAAIKEVDFYFTGPMSEQIAGDKSEEVSSSMQASEAIRQQAKQAFANQDYASTVRFANNAIKSFLDTAHKTTHAPSAQEQQEKLYQRSLNKVTTFNKALQQAIKDSKQNIDATVENINSMVAEAQQLAAQQKFNEGKVLLDKVLIAIKLNIDILMRGSVLIAEKDNSPKGLYEYELFRSETYKAMLNMLRSQGKQPTYSTNSNILNHEAVADKLHDDAQALAEQGNYTVAAQKLTDATINYKSAVRSSGIPLPAAFHQILTLP